MSLIITLIAIGVLLMILELFLPGGISGVCGALMLLAGCVFVFKDFGFVIGCWATLGIIAFTLFFFVLCLKALPKMPLGKQLLHTADAKDWLAYNPQQQGLIGKIGKARTLLRPAGIAVIDGQRLDVVTAGEMIEKDAAVKVIQVEGNRIVVAEVTNE